MLVGGSSGGAARTGTRVGGTEAPKPSGDTSTAMCGLPVVRFLAIHAMHVGELAGVCVYSSLVFRPRTAPRGMDRRIVSTPDLRLDPVGTAHPVVAFPRCNATCLAAVVRGTLGRFHIVQTTIPNPRETRIASDTGHHFTIYIAWCWCVDANVPAACSQSQQCLMCTARNRPFGLAWLGWESGIN